MSVLCMDDGSNNFCFYIGLFIPKNGLNPIDNVKHTCRHNMRKHIKHCSLYNFADIVCQVEQLTGDKLSNLVYGWVKGFLTIHQRNYACTENCYKFWGMCMNRGSFKLIILLSKLLKNGNFNKRG